MPEDTVLKVAVDSAIHKIMHDAALQIHKEFGVTIETVTFTWDEPLSISFAEPPSKRLSNVWLQTRKYY